MKNGRIRDTAPSGGSSPVLTSETLHGKKHREFLTLFRSGVRLAHTSQYAESLVLGLISVDRHMERNRNGVAQKFSETEYIWSIKDDTI